MRVVVGLDHRFSRLPDGSIWTKTFFGNSFWQRYLAVFDSVLIVARVEDAPELPASAKRVDGPGVSVWPVAYYVGPKEYMLKRRLIQRQIAGCIKAGDAVILRASGQMANCLEGELKRAGRPYGVEIVADPYDVFSPGAMRHPLRPLLQWWFPRQLRRQCARAAATAYVTAGALQRRYPGHPSAFSTHYSSVEMGPEAFVSTPRAAPPTDRPLRLLMAGTLEELYKGPDVLIEAFALCRREFHLEAELSFLGDGRQRASLEELATRLGVPDKVHFLGSVAAGAAVREQLDRADLFILPSRQEGLPRAIIEAMARALPCIGSTVGGIPELLEREDLIPPNDARQLAAKIMEFAGSPSRLEKSSARNLARAEDYREEILSARRASFYEQVRNSTAQWIQQAAAEPGLLRRETYGNQVGREF